MAAAVIIKSDERRERQGQILRDFGHDPRTAGREAREQAEHFCPWNSKEPRKNAMRR